MMTDPTSPAPSTSSVSAAELAEIRESITTLHRTDADGFCNWCGDTYPCAMAVVMHALDAAEHALDASRAEAAALRAERDTLQAIIVAAVRGVNADRRDELARSAAPTPATQREGCTP